MKETETPFWRGFGGTFTESLCEKGQHKQVFGFQSRKLSGDWRARFFFPPPSAVLLLSCFR